MLTKVKTCTAADTTLYENEIDHLVMQDHPFNSEFDSIQIHDLKVNLQIVTAYITKHTLSGTSLTNIT